MCETPQLQHFGTPEQVAEATAASAPTEPPTKEQLTSIYESMRAAGWDTRPTL